MFLNKGKTRFLWNMSEISCVVAAGVGPTADPAGWRLSATAHQTAASYSDTTDWDILNSGRTGKTFHTLCVWSCKCHRIRKAKMWSDVMIQYIWLKRSRRKDSLRFLHRWATSWPSRQLLSRSSCKGSNSSENSSSRRRNKRPRPRGSRPSMQPARTTSFRNKCVLHQAEPAHLSFIHPGTQQIVKLVQ